MTTTAHEDQFTYAEISACKVISRIEARETEADAIAAWLERHGYREIAARIRAGEHLA